MIINQDNGQKAEVIGEVVNKKATINAAEIAKLQYLLTKGLYSDPIGAVIVEWTNNAVDSMVQAGKDPIKNPVMVEIDTAGFGNYIFRVSDKGIGLNRQDFEDICMSYLTSTKTNNNDTIGAFGIGMKSFLSLERNAIFTCRKDGVEWKFNAYMGAEFMEYDLLYEMPTKEENGVICELNIKSWSEYRTFVEKAKLKLAYYDTVALVIEKNMVENTIHREGCFQRSTLVPENTQLHMSLKDVYYPIDFSKLGILAIHIPLCIRFGLDEGLQPTPSREALIYNDHTINLIKSKINELAELMVGKYNTLAQESEKFIDVAHVDDSSHIIPVADIKLDLRRLSSHSKIPLSSVKVKGLKYGSFQFYKSRLDYLTRGYDSIHVNYAWNNYRRKHIDTGNISSAIKSKVPVVKVNDFLRGHMKEFLITKYPSGTVFVKKIKEYSTPLGKKSGNAYGSFTYISIIGLSNVPKSEWRERIKEWQKVEREIEESYVDETDVENSQEFRDFVEQKKLERKNSPKAHQVLNKQEGEVTIATAYIGRTGVCFKKATHKVSELSKHKGLRVIIEEGDEGLVKYIMDRCPRYISFVKIGPRELKKISKIHNLVNMDEFMSEDSKPFRRMVTKIVVGRMLQAFDNTNIRTNPIIKQCLEKVDKEIEFFREYSKNIDYWIDEEYEGFLIAVAEEKNLWDYEVYDRYLKLNKELDMLDFIPSLKEPRAWNPVETRRYHRLINQMVYFKKKYKGEFDDFEIVPKDVLIGLSEEEVTEDEEETELETV